MAAIWVVFGHTAVISKNEKCPVDIGDSNTGPYVCITERLTTVPLSLPSYSLSLLLLLLLLVIIIIITIIIITIIIVIIIIIIIFIIIIIIITMVIVTNITPLMLSSYLFS